MHTEPSISQTLRLGIKRLLGNNTKDVPAQPDLFKAQSSLGFMSLFDGTIHQDWAKTVDTSKYRNTMVGSDEKARNALKAD
eukprot:4904259-Ditylum_brightwellii.AAC.1